MLLVGFKYHLSDKCLLTNGLMKNGESAVTQQIQITVRHLSHFAKPVAAAKYLLLLYVYC